MNRPRSTHGRLPRSFYARPTLEVAADLLGKVLVHCTPDGVTAGAIVEAEAYIGEDDPACHAARGLTPRNRPLYGAPGYAYVYFSYGVHYLANAVTEAKGRPAAVLLRALEPLEGLSLMARRRSRPGARDIPADALCRGPGNLTRAMGISLDDNEADLCGSRLFIVDRGIQAGEVAWSARIGISSGTDRLWRCFIATSPAVSATRREP